MKRITVLALLAIIGCCFFACSTPSTLPSLDVPATIETNAYENAGSTQSTQIADDVNSSIPTLPVYTPGQIELNPGEDYCDDHEVYFKRHYRLIYYRIPSPIDSFAGEEGYAFLAEVSAQAVNEDLPEMLLVSFVKRFKIEKEIFEDALKTIESNYQNAGVDMQNEEFEIPNADIIYTFDNDIINEYYRRR